MFEGLPMTCGISMPNSTEVDLGWALVMSESEVPVKRLNSRSTLGCTSNALRFELAHLLWLGVFPLLRWRVKFSSRSVEDCSSVSLAEDIVLQVAELPLLSDELDEWPGDLRHKTVSAIHPGPAPLPCIELLNILNAFEALVAIKPKYGSLLSMKNDYTPMWSPNPKSISMNSTPDFQGQES
uniref:Putative WRKY transcription factor 19 n=1 Tax=Rhizophora mucronata TaxID=61149 RepID=A0A2P2LHH9_RHIMU